MAVVAAVRKRRTELTGGQLMFRAGCWPGAIGTVATLLSIGAMGGDPSAGLGMFVALMITPVIGIGFFITGLIGGLLGLGISNDK